MQNLMFKTLSLLLFIIISVDLAGQSPSLLLNVEVNDAELGNNDGQIILSTNNQPPFVYQLFDDIPWEGGKEIATSGEISDKNFIFKDLFEGKYIVCVTNNEKTSKCEIAVIQSKE